MDLITLLALTTITLAMIGIVYWYNTRKPITEVLLLRPRDHRGKRLRVTDETDLGLICKRKGGAVHRFLKAGRGWVFSDERPTATRFIGVEGYAYTAIMREAAKMEVKLSEAIKLLWGTQFYNTIPQEQRNQLENHEFGVTIDPIKIGDQASNVPSAEAVNDEDESRVLHHIAKNAKGTTTAQDLYKAILPFALGAFVMFFLVTRGYI